MEFHRGRLIDHIQLRCVDLDASRRFYEAVLGALGRELVQIAPGLLVADELCLSPSDGPTSRNNIEAVYHGPAKRSAPSVVITA